MRVRGVVRLQVREGEKEIWKGRGAQVGVESRKFEQVGRHTGFETV